MSATPDLTTREGRAAARATRLAQRPTTSPADVCRRLVELIAEATGEDWTFGYVGNVDRYGDDRAWYAFRPHPGRVGTREDRIGGVRTDELDRLVDTLGGALRMARMLKS